MPTVPGTRQQSIAERAQRLWMLERASNATEPERADAFRFVSAIAVLAGAVVRIGLSARATLIPRLLNVSPRRACSRTSSEMRRVVAASIPRWRGPNAGSVRGSARGGPSWIPIGVIAVHTRQPTVGVNQHETNRKSCVPVLPADDPSARRRRTFFKAGELARKQRAHGLKLSIIRKRSR
jgi:hypothetical protein